MTTVALPAATPRARRGLVERSIMPGFGLTMGFTVFYLSVIVLIPLSAVLLILQAFAHAIRSWQIFKSEAKA